MEPNLVKAKRELFMMSTLEEKQRERDTHTQMACIKTGKSIKEAVGDRRDPDK